MRIFYTLTIKRADNAANVFIDDVLVGTVSTQGDPVLSRKFIFEPKGRAMKLTVQGVNGHFGSDSNPSPSYNPAHIEYTLERTTVINHEARTEEIGGAHEGPIAKAPDQVFHSAPYILAAA